MCIKKKNAFFAFFAKNAFPAPVSLTYKLASVHATWLGASKSLGGRL